MVAFAEQMTDEGASVRRAGLQAPSSVSLRLTASPLRGEALAAAAGPRDETPPPAFGRRGTVWPGQSPSSCFFFASNSSWVRIPASSSSLNCFSISMTSAWAPTPAGGAAGATAWGTVSWGTGAG